jgi:hypothetical protein
MTLPHTLEWYRARLGRPTASQIWRVMSKRRDGKPSETRATYILDLVMERRSCAGYAPVGVNPVAVQWGIDHEDEARERYVAETGNDVEAAPFIDHPKLFSGATPDGLIGDDGLLEIKAPYRSTNHLRNSEGEIAQEYRYQVAWQLACSGRRWCDFVSNDPRWYGDEQIIITRVPRDDGLIAEMETEVGRFLDEVEAHCRRLDELAARRRAA